jgi:hypothetical protein
LAAGFGADFGDLGDGGAAVSCCAGDSDAESSSAGGSTLATPTELDSVRWQVSQVTMVRTSVPSWCCSFRKVRGRPQNEQNATSVVTTT